MTDYVQFTEMKETLELRSETFADDDLKLAISAASGSIDSICGRSFNVPDEDADDTTRLFEARRERWIEIDDCSAITTVESGQTTFRTWADTDYVAGPLNHEALNVPITELKVAGSFCLVPGQTIIKVTGKFGWPEIPSAIKQATILLASRYMKRAREAPFGVAGIGADGMAVRIGYSDPDVKSLLAPFTRPTRLA
ncbi:MAG: hypothetical protein ACRDK1_00630 [Solirubrobacterales bacterium]